MDDPQTVDSQVVSYWVGSLAVRWLMVLWLLSYWVGSLAVRWLMVVMASDWHPQTKILTNRETANIGLDSSVGRAPEVVGLSPTLVSCLCSTPKSKKSPHVPHWKQNIKKRTTHLKVKIALFDN